MNRLLLVLGVLLLSSGASYAGHHSCCADCGCNTGLRKVCRWECEEEEVSVPGWDCECEDIVIPGKSPFCVKHNCEGCDKCSGHMGIHRHHTKVWGAPSGCRVKTVKLLVRTEKKVKKTVWKHVIETVCDTCCAAGNCAAGPVPVSNGPPTEVPTMAPQDGAVAPVPPMPPEASPCRPSLRRRLNPILSAFAPASQQR